MYYLSWANFAIKIAFQGKFWHQAISFEVIKTIIWIKLATKDMYHYEDSMRTVCGQ